MFDLKAIRKKHGMTGATLGEKAKTSPSTLSMIERPYSQKISILGD